MVCKARNYNEAGYCQGCDYLGERNLCTDPCCKGYRWYNPLWQKWFEIKRDIVPVSIIFLVIVLISLILEVIR